MVLGLRIVVVDLQWVYSFLTVGVAGLAGASDMMTSLDIELEASVLTAQAELVGVTFVDPFVEDEIVLLR
jgi:hypothetical protein